MECPFCAETIKNEAIACKHCSRDLRVVRPMLIQIQDISSELETLNRDLERAKARLERHKNPHRYFLSRTIVYALIPTLLLVAAHVLVTIVLNVSPLPLRLASVIIPLLFGLLAYPLNKIWFEGAAPTKDLGQRSRDAIGGTCIHQRVRCRRGRDEAVAFSAQSMTEFEKRAISPIELIPHVNPLRVVHRECARKSAGASVVAMTIE